MTINSDQVNYLVLRYLRESGFEHSAFSLKNEMRNADQLDKAWATRVPTGHLINSLQRAVMFEDCMAQLNEDGTEKKDGDAGPVTLIPSLGGLANLDTSLGKKDGTNIRKANGESKQDMESTDINNKAQETSRIAAGNTISSKSGTTRDVVMTDGPSMTGINGRTPAILNKVILLEGHTQGLDQCLWSPEQSGVVATSSVDGTARIWTLPKNESSKPTGVTLSCSPCRTKDKSVTSIAWSPNGQALSTGSYDGVSRLWTLSGAKSHRDLVFHTGPVFAMKWSRRGDLLLTGSADGMIGVWNTSNGTLSQKWDLRSPVMDLEWISDALFLSACKGGTLKMWQLGRDTQAKKFQGHETDIGLLRWNSNINLGATAADDGLVKVWRADSEHPTQVLKHHRTQIHALDWARTDHGDHRLLASASRDGQACIWDVVRGELLHVLQHDKAIFTLHFSIMNMLATGGAEGETTVWNAETGRIVSVHRPKNHSTIYHLKFSNDGSRVAVARSDPIALVVNMAAS